MFAGTAYGGAYPLIVRSVAEAAATREIAGCGCIGAISGGREFESGPSLAVLVLGGGTIHRDAAVRTAIARAVRARPQRELVEAREAASGREQPALPFSRYLQPRSEKPPIAVLARELPGVTVVGGGVTEDGSIGETFQFCGDVVSSNAVAGMLLAGDFHAQPGRRQCVRAALARPIE